MDVHAAIANRSKPDGSRDDARVALVGELAGAIGFRHVGYVPTPPPAALPVIDALFTWLGRRRCAGARTGMTHLAPKADRL
jgi:hypothetical protein